MKLFTKESHTLKKGFGSLFTIFSLLVTTICSSLSAVIQPSTQPDNLYLATLNTNAVQRAMYIVLEIMSGNATLLVYFPPIPSNAILPTALNQVPELEMNTINVTKSIASIVEDGSFEETFTIEATPVAAAGNGYTVILTGVTQFLDTELRAVDFFKYQGVPFPSAVDPALQLNYTPFPIPIHYRVLDSNNNDVVAWTAEQTGLFLAPTYENNFIIKVDNSFGSTKTTSISFKISFDPDTLAAFNDGVYGTNFLVQMNPYDPENLENNLTYLSQLDIAQTVFLTNLISDADGLLTSQNLVIELTDAEAAVVAINRTKVENELRTFLTVSQAEWNRIAAENPNPSDSVANTITSMQTFLAQQLAAL